MGKMNKAEFLAELRRSLSGMQERDIERSLDYYAEMIDDRVEDGVTEEDAVAGLGDINDCVMQIMSETPSPHDAKTAKAKAKAKPKRKLRTWEIVLLAVGSPVWVPLTLAAAVVALACVITAFALVLSVFAVLYCLVISFAAVVVAGIIEFLTSVAIGEMSRGLFILGMGVASAGLAIISYICAAHFTVFAGKAFMRAVTYFKRRREIK